MVFVLDQKKKPLMPCTPKRARLLLRRGRAVVHRVQPFVIRLRDRRLEDSVLQPIALKVDPGSKHTGMTLARMEQTEEGEIHHALFLSEVGHRGKEVHAAKQTQRNARRRRRSANVRHRQPRFLNRGIKKGWLAPSLLSRVGNVLTWTTVGRIQVRKSGSFSIKTATSDIDGINAKYFHLIQRGDGYQYAIAECRAEQEGPLPCSKEGKRHSSPG